MLSYGSAAYQYNAAGSLTNKAIGGQTTSYRYDALGNLLNVALLGGPNIEYLVDGLQRRVGKKVNGSLARGYLYQNQLKPVAELDGSMKVVSRFVYASRLHVPDYMVRSGTTYRIVSDHVGSVRLVVNTSDGTIAQRIDYDEFGRVLQDTNPGFQPFGFAGGLYDPDTGLVRFGYRDYDSSTGRWLSKDPILFAGGQANLYVYCNNDGINFIDPWGLGESHWWEDALGWVVDHWSDIVDAAKELLGLETKYGADAITIPAGEVIGYSLEAAENPEIGYGALPAALLGAQARDAALNGDFEKADQLLKDAQPYLGVLNGWEP